ncbi:MAG: hypothetical protein KJ645_06160, partial [Planctomycetes bacterium]|nr:hypothetical protein [Planctomycetota bacterium]
FFVFIKNRLNPGTPLPAFDASVATKGKRPEFVTRVPPQAFRENILAILGIVDDLGGRSVLLDPNLINYYAHKILIDIALEREIPLVSSRKILENKASPGSYTEAGSENTHRRIAIQVKGLPIDEEGDTRPAVLAKAPLGDIRFPLLEDRPLFNDDGTGNDLVAGDGIFTATFQDDGSRDFEFAPCFSIVLQKSLTSRLFLNNDTFYMLPEPESLGKFGLYYSPVIDFEKPPFREYLMDFDFGLPNKRGAELIAEVLISRISEIMDH